MSLDLTLLQLLKERPRFQRLARGVPARALDPTTKLLLDAFRDYFHAFPDVQVVHANEFLTWAKLGKFRKSTDESLAKLGAVMQRVDQGCDPSREDGMLRLLAEAAYAADTLAAVAAYNDGEDIDLPARMAELKSEFESFARADVNDPSLPCNIEELLAEAEDDSGIHFRLNSLNRSMRPMRGGDAILFAARPDRGKGTFIVSEATHWATQIEAEFGPDRPIVLMVNEGPGKRVWPRLFSAALGVGDDELIHLSNAGVLRQKYATAIEGFDNIRIVEIHGQGPSTIEKTIRRLNPSILVLDMLANVRWEARNGATRTDQIVEQQAQWARDIAVNRDIVVMSTVQLSAEAEGIQFPPMSVLKDSKTGLQGACDAIIIAGSSNDPMLSGSRYMGIPKNKMRRPGAPGNPMVEVMIESEKARYTDAPT